MARKKKRRNRDRDRVHRLHAADDLHLAIGGDVVDRGAWRRSIDEVAKLDREWLRQHPEAEYRLRPITQLEVEMSGCPADSDVCVRRGPHGMQIRMVLLPKHL